MMVEGEFEPSVISPEREDDAAICFAFRGYRLLVHSGGESVHLPRLGEIRDWKMPVIRRQYLGRLDGTHTYSLEMPEDIEPPDGLAFEGLRRLYGRLPDEHFRVAGAAVQIVDWDRTHQYCGRCGEKTQNKTDERAKTCPKCGLVSYPRISPAIIVLIQRGDQILLARSWRHPPDLFSVLAGFVEPGESLEQAVSREIWEEVGLEVKDIHYFGSQPWPFPNSLMVAFTCRYASGKITINREEMHEAGWYGRENLPRVPPKMSIARQLIDWYVEQGKSQ